MRIIQVHNQYVYRGGEDAVLDAEKCLLQQHGHEVHQFLRNNHEIAEKSQASVAVKSIWSNAVYTKFKQLLRNLKPSVVHVHNTMPLVSPSVYFASAHEGIPVVQSLHNYRLMCVNGQFLRNGQVCEICIDKSFPWPGIVNKCYRGSRSASAAVAALHGIHRGFGTWRNKITRYIALTNFARNKLVAGGLPAEKIRVKPNFAVDPGYADNRPGRELAALAIGRLSHEKGIDSLIAAWKDVPIPLNIAGDGPLREKLSRAAPSHVRFLGHVEKEQLIPLMQKSAFLVAPSVCYETCPMVVIEALASGLPVIASRLGALAELVEDGTTGVLFSPGDIADMTSKFRWATEHEDELQAMGSNGRQVYVREFTPQANYETLMDIYHDAIDAAR